VVILRRQATGDFPLAFFGTMIVMHNTNQPNHPTPRTYNELQRAFDFFNERLFAGDIPQCLLTLQRKANSRGYFSAERFINAEGRFVDEIALNPETFAMQTVAGILSTLVHEMCHAWRHHFGGETPGRKSYHDRIWANRMESLGLSPSSTGLPGGKRTGQHVTHYIVAGGAFDQSCAELIDQGYIIDWFDRHTATSALNTQFVHSPDGAPAAIHVAMGIDSGNQGQDEEGGDENPTHSVVPQRCLGAQVASQLERPQEGQQAIDRSNRLRYSCPQCGVNAWGKPDLNLVCGDCTQTMLAY